MVLSLALKPYQGKITPYVKRIVKESGIANVTLDSATSEKHPLSARKRNADLVDVEPNRDKLNEKDKTQLKSVLDKL